MKENDMEKDGIENMAEAEEKNAYAYWLSNLAGVGDKTILQLTKVHKDPREIYERWKKAGDQVPPEYEQLLTAKQQQTIREAIRSLGSWDVMAEYEKLEQQGIRFFTISSEEYPQRLRNIPDPPYGIYVKGEVPKEDILSVAIIGARECSEYGRFVGGELGKVLGKNGVQVISGMARGVDGISQAACLEAGGTSYGVLGCGVDICYPSGNRKLYDWLLTQGGILSSYPPGTLPKAQLFPPRNRIVSGLSDVVIVVEARQKSGTLITVDMALEQGREVYVVPGRLTDRLSDGCNKLMKQGAGIILSPEDFLREMSESFPGMVPGMIPTKAMTANSETEVTDGKKQNGKKQSGKSCEAKSPGKGKQAIGPQPDTLEQKVYEGIDFYPRSVDQIKEATGVDIPYYQMQQILMKLCMTGKVRQVSIGFYEKNASTTGF